MTKALSGLADEMKEIVPGKACLIIQADKKQDYSVADVRSPGEHEGERIPESKSILLIE